MAGLRVLGFSAAVGMIGWLGWQVINVLEGDARRMPAAAKAVVVEHVLLITNGVLDDDWIRKTLALPKNAALMGLDLKELCQRVEASGQVSKATLKLNFPDTLAVTLVERSPVARLLAKFGDDMRKELLVARDGVVFEGEAFDPEMIKTLPWIEVTALKRRGQTIEPIGGMETVAELLDKAKHEATDLYQNLNVVSLVRLPTDGEIEVRLRDETKIIFGTREDFFRQIARLELLLDTAVKTHPGKAMVGIDLSAGADVRVVVAAPLPAAKPGGEIQRAGFAPSKPAAMPAFSSSISHPNLPIRIKTREF